VYFNNSILQLYFTTVFQKEGWEWVKSELFYKKEMAKQKEREKNNPMKQCVLKFDHFENIHR
jgi:hypothetical protein